MKKLINNPDNVITEALRGVAAAHGDLLKVCFDPHYIARADAPRLGKVALILGVAGAVIFGDWHLGAVLALAMMVNQVVAALGGVLVPLTLDRMGLDPALASGTFVTTLTDVMGFFAFLGLATVMLT